MKVLHIDSSILGEGSASRSLTEEIVAGLKLAHPDTEVTHLDLAAEGLPHLSPKSLARSDEGEPARSAAALEQFLAADVLVRAEGLAISAEHREASLSAARAAIASAAPVKTLAA